MKNIDIEEANADLLALIEQVTQGEPCLITKDGKPIANLSSYTDTPKRKRIGMLQGVYTVPDDIDTPFAKEIEEMFYGKKD